MKRYWQFIYNKFEALNTRERWLVSGALFVVVYSAINALLVSPVLARQATLQNELASDQAQIQALTLQINDYARQPVIDPDAANKARINALQSSLQSLETQLSGLQTTLISPDKMPALLRSLLKKNGNLKLISLKTLPTQGLLDTPKANDSATTVSSQTPQTNSQDAPVYKHGVEITVEGKYLDLLAYVADLEQMPWHVLWSKAALNEEQSPDMHWPANRLKLTVYTLSLDKTWLSI